MDSKFEMIGGIKLDLSDYPGEDFYSEGEMENLLLELVKNNTEDDYNKLIAQNQYWSVLYHLSHVRGNIVDFIPLKKGDKVLEVGSGCGAITAALAKSGADITCIELSKQRSLINAYRNKDRDNIEIKVGNYEDIEKKLDSDFDYIFMIGVFEYGGAYINSDNPYIDFLNTLYSHLRPGGAVYMAIENKYGMKYFAGCREDHTGSFYEGIEGYKKEKGVKTFSLNSLKKMAKETKFSTSFYYPYPDYKLPVTIYSDERLPYVGELYNPMVNFDASRVIAFDEVSALNEVIKEGEFGRYANSFLLKLSKGEETRSFAERHVIYSKHSNERDDKLKIRTDIEKDGYNKLFVVKRPCHKGAIEHIKNMKTAFENLSSQYKNSGFSVNKCILKETENEIAAEFEFIKAQSLEEKLDSIFKNPNANKDSIINEIDKYVERINGIESTDNFAQTDDFNTVFGKEDLPTDLKSFKTSNIDLIFSNIFTDDNNTVVDYEWTFDFAVPVKFVIYRALHYYFDKDEEKQKFLKENDLYNKYGIDLSLLECFERCEMSFQRYIAGDNISLIGFHSIFGQDAYDINDLVKKESVLSRKWKLCVYYDKGNGFNQEDTVYYKAETWGDNMIINIPIDSAKALRIDPSDEPCMVKLESMVLKNKNSEKEIKDIMVNGIYLNDGMIYFAKEDPQIIIPSTADGEVLELKYSITAFRRDFFAAIGDKLGIDTSLLHKKKGPYEKVRLS